MGQGTLWAELKGKDFLPPNDEWLGPLLAPILRALTQRQRQVIYLRFVLELRQAEIAKILGVNQQRVSTVQRQALGKFRIDLPSSISRRFVGSLGKSPRSKPSSRKPRDQEPVND